MRSEWCGLANNNIALLAFRVILNWCLRGNALSLPPHIILLLARKQCMADHEDTDRQTADKLQEGRCNTDRRGWSIDGLEDMGWTTFSLRVSGRRVTVQADGGGTDEWLADIFNPQRQEAQIIFKQKKNLIMSSLLWLMIKDNYFFIPLTMAEYVPSDVAT